MFPAPHPKGFILLGAHPPGPLPERETPLDSTLLGDGHTDELSNYLNRVDTLFPPPP